MRESISMLKLVATPENTWLTANSATIESIRRRLSVLANTSISGSEAIATTQAYTVIIIPVCASPIPKSAPMSLRRPIGMNSEVLNMNAASIRPARGIHCFIKSPFVQGCSHHFIFLSTPVVSGMARARAHMSAADWDISTPSRPKFAVSRKIRGMKNSPCLAEASRIAFPGLRMV